MIDPDELPEVAQVLRAGHLADETSDDAEFDFRLECILDGVDALVARMDTTDSRSGLKR
ncbi:MAG: hypothetical protein M3082_01275 [Candidatus Dormibacteraeota bacterium]|nr:hypothetical protein [Candidatus Dormibacteraeota bacterium]